MKSTDKFLIGIVAGILLLVAAAVAVVLLRPKANYLPEDTPEDTVHNYLFALRQEDYDRAYSYLSPQLKGYPATAEEFASDIRDGSYAFYDVTSESVTFEVGDSRAVGENRRVTVHETHFYGGGLFDSSQYDSTFDLTLRQEAGQWKIVSADSYWLDCWDETKGCD